MANLSSLIAPFRWYDKYHNQNRFDIDCNSECEFKLITDPFHMLPFQFKRNPSPYLLTDWILRPCCDDPNRKVLDKVDTNFVYESMNWVDVNLVDVNAWNANCDGGVCANVGGGEKNETRLEWTGLTIGKTYTYNVIVSKLSTVSGPLVFYCGATTMFSITAPGVYTGTFVALATTMNFAYPLITDGEDEYCIQYVQLEQAFELSANDVILDEDMIKYFNDGTYDYFVHCGVALAEKLPLGCYYSIIQDEGGNLYYSEVITIKEFTPEKSPYLLLQWSNTCDLKDLIYHTFQGCSYVNKLWIEDGVLTKPTYPFKEDGEEDGNQSFNATFQKLDKTVNLIVPKCPEFIIDALNGVRLHDTIQFYKPINTKQELVDDPILVKSAEADTQFIFQDCFANMELKLLLFEKFVDETCCNNIEAPECHGCIEVPEIDEFDSDVYEYALILTPGSDEVGLYQYDGGGGWVLLDGDSDVLICDTNGFIWQYQPTHPLAVSGYVKTVVLATLTYVSGTTWNVTGAITTFSYALVQYSTDGGTIWNDTLTKLTPAQLSAGASIVFPNNPCCGTFLARIQPFDLNNCVYDPSASLVVNSPTNDCC